MKKYIVLLALLLAGIFSSHAQQMVSVTPGSITVPQQGGTYTLKVDYAPSPDSLFDWRMARYTAPYSDIQVSDNGNLTVRVTFPANTGYTPRSGSITLYYPDPTNYYGSQVWGSCSFSQQGLTPDYSIKIAPTSVSHPAEGGYSSLKVSYKNRTEAVSTTFLGASGLPAGYRITAGANGALSLYGGANKTGSVVSGTVTISYSNPLNANRPETASFTVTQQPIPSWIALSPKSLSVSGTGGSYYCSVAYSDPDTLFNIDYRSYSGGASQLNSVGAFGSNQIHFNFKKNQTQSTITGQITVYVTDPINSSRQLSDVVSFTQPPAPYDIRFAQNSATMPAAGGSHNFQASYVHRDGPVTLTYRGCSGLPSWCTLTAGANGALALSCTANTSNTSRSATVTVSYNNPLNASQPVTASFSLSQQPLSYNITIPNNTLSVAAKGETKTLSLAYVDRTGTVGLTYKSCSGLPSGATVTAGSNGTFSVAFPSNTTSATRSGTATIYYTNPLNSSQPVSAAFSYSQQPLPYNITIPNNSLSVAAAGETKTLSLAYVDRTGTVGLTYQSCSGLPSGATVTAGSNGTFSVAFPSNTTSAIRSGTATIYYANPISGAQPVSATFTYSQQPLPYNITIPNNSLTVAPSGETKTITLAYSQRPGTVGLTYLNATGVPAWCTLTPNSGGTLSAACTANSGNTARSATITVSYTNPLNSAQPVTASFSLSQQPQSYAIRASSSSYSITSGGGSTTVSIVYTERSGSMDIEYINCSGVPAWCTISAGSGGHLTISAERNISGQNRYANLSVSYANPLSSAQPVTASFSVSQESMSSWITVTPKSVEVAGDGGTKYFDLGYSIDSMFTFQYLGCSGDLGQVRSGRIVGENRLAVEFEKNQASTAVSGKITFNFRDPANSSGTLSDVVAFTQQPAPYDVSLAQSSFSIPSGGGTQNIQMNYVHRDGPVALSILSTSGLPDGCSLSTAANGVLVLTCNANPTNATRTPAVTVNFNNPLNANAPIPVSFSFSQLSNNYAVSLPQNSISPAPGGGSATLAVNYQYRTDPVSLSIHHTDGLPEGCTLTHNGSGILTATFPANLSTATRSGTATVFFNNPVNAAQPLPAAFTYSQNPASFNINISQTTFTIAPEGGTVTIPLSYVDRPDKVALDYLGAENLPGEYTLSQSGDKSSLSLQAKPNRTSMTRYHNITARFSNPLSASQPVMATFSVSQEPMSSWILMTPQSAEVSGSGETKYFDLNYSVDSIFTFQYLGCSGDQGQVASARIIGDNRLAVEFAKNLNDETITRNITFNFRDPANSSGTLSDIVTITQRPAPYDIRFQQSEIELASGGGTQTLGLVYTVRPGTVALNYLRCSEHEDWFTLTSGANGALSLEFSPNEDSTERTASVTVFYENPLDGNNPVAATLSLRQAPLSYDIVLPAQNIVVPKGGGDAEVSVSYAHRSGPVSLTFQGAWFPQGISLPKAWSVSVKENRNLNFHMDANGTWEDRTGTIEVSYVNPLGMIPVKGTFTYYQQPLDYSIRFTSHTQLTAAAEGRTYTLQLGYVSLDEPIKPYQIIYDGTEGLPQGSRVTAGENGQLQVYIPGNDIGAERSGTMTVTYIDPNDSDHTVTASLPYVQPALDFSLQVDTPSFTVAPEGGEKHLQVSFSDRQADLLLVYAGSSDLPEDCSLLAADDGNLILKVGANPSWSARQIECQVFYFLPDDQTATISASFSFTQAAMDHSISVTPQSVTFSPGGESKILQVTYNSPNKPLTLVYKECTGLPNGAFVTVHPDVPGLLTVTFPDNPGAAAKNGRATIVYTDAANEHREETYFDYTQGSVTQMVILSPSALSVSPAGGKYLVNAEVFLPDSLDCTANYRGIRNLPDSVQAQGSGAMVNLTFPANETGQAKYGSIEIIYANPADETREISNTLTYVQPSCVLSEHSVGSMTQRIYRNGNGSHYNTTVIYRDGLGRPVQSVAVGAAPASSTLPQGGDWVSFMEYDCMGRTDSVGYLPYVRAFSAGAGTAPDVDPYASQQTFYAGKFGMSVAPYAMQRTVYGSGLGFVQARNTPGEAHRLSDGYYTRYDYRLNTAADAIARYVVQADGSLLSQGVFAAGQLSVRRSVDAKDGDQTQRHETLEYTDPNGRTIASEVYVSASDRRITYYVYDDLDRLRYVLPPMADTFDCSTAKTAQELGSYCYYTEYDDRGNVVRSQTPGAEYTLSIYDRRGRLAMSQDGNQRGNGQWSFVKYDVFDRPVLSGVVTGGTFESHRAALEAATVLYEERGSAVHGYTNRCYPSVPDESAYLKISYYDDYGWLGPDDAHAFAAADALHQSPSADVRDMLTGTKNKVLGIDADRWLTSATYYDDFSRPVQSVSDLYPSGVEITSNTHNFAGQVTRTKVRQTVGDQTYGYDKWLLYDSFGRLLSIRQRVDGDDTNGTVTLASYTYDELGNVAAKSIHGQTETETYAYDLNGRTSAVASPSFSYGLDYEQSAVTGTVPRLDGNISALRWGAGTTPDNAYAYNYDAVGQLAAAAYKTAAGGAWSASEAYAEKNLSYDRHGNIQTLLRTGEDGSPLHELTEMTYDGNRLQSLRLNGAAPVSYAYDPNGNMSSDGRRGVTIGYNILNLPEEIIAGNQKINYIYSASGEKLACDANGSSTYYRGGVMVYGADDKLLYMLTPEGTVSRSEGSAGTSYTYNYFKKDHIGSTRAVLSAVDDTLQTVQSTDYYPFGLAFSTNNLNKNKYLFSGKELQDGNLGGSMLGLYDFGARHYDPFVARWLTIDLYAKAYPSVSPYNYCLNNPVNLVDLLGLSPTKIDSVADGKGGWYYVYELEEITVTAPKDQDNPHYPIFYIPSWDFGPVGSTSGDNLGPINENFSGGGGNGNNPSKTNPIIDNTWQALVHYFRGKGVPVHIGDNTTKRLLQHPDFVAYHHKIINGTITSKNEFSINMTYEIFHIGRTNVEYEFNQDDRSVTYQLFSNDGFWDPDFIDEYFLGDKSMYFRPDGMGPNLERFGGQPYPYIPRTVIVK